jgi:hypothetical protein
MTPAELDRLGKDLTPSGAIRAGNADGSIPAWDGGIKKPAGYVPGTPYVDPFPEDKPVIKITAANMAQYADKLTESHKALLKAYDSFYMNIYPTRRTWGAPEWYYEATKKTAANAELVAGGNGFQTGGPIGGVPFPMPTDPVEIIWNHITRWRGIGHSQRHTDIISVTRSGELSITKNIDRIIFRWDNPAYTDKELANVIWYFKQETLSPPRMAGRVLLVHETLNQNAEARRAWLYSPGQRRVRRAPEYGFDNPFEGADGMMTVDQNDTYSGSPERYDWKLIGKKEMYIPYNAYRVNSKDLKYKDIFTPLHPNPQYLRYELHRVWVVEGTLKEGARHLYKRRTMYVDEDSNTIHAVDLYDNRDQLWRIDENHNFQYYDVPCTWTGWEFHYDLQLGRYVGNWGRNENSFIPDYTTSPDEGIFDPGALRRSGKR